MKMRHLYFVMVLLISSCSDLNQDPDQSSEESRQYNIKTDQALSYIEQILNQDPNQALKLLDSIALVDSLPPPLLLRWCMGYGQAANDLYKNEVLPLSKFEKVLDQYDEFPDSKDYPWLKFYLANIYIEQKRQLEAWDIYSKVLKIADEMGDYELAGDACSALGWIDWHRDNYAQARIKFERTLRYYQQLGNDFKQVNALGNIAYVLIEQGQAQQALDYALEAEKIAASSDISRLQGVCSSILAQVYRELGNYKLAEIYGIRSIELDSINSAPHYTVLSRTYFLQKKYDKVHWCLDQAEKAPSLNRYTPRTIALYRADLAQAQGHFDEEQLYRMQYRALRDSLNLVIVNLQLAGNESKIMHLQHEIGVLESIVSYKNNLVVVAIAIILMIILITYLFNRWKRSNELRHMLANTQEYLRQLEEQEAMFESIEQRTYARMQRKGLLPPELEGVWSDIVEDEMHKMMWEKLREKERQRK